jgi:hypothetical protein
MTSAAVLTTLTSKISTSRKRPSAMPTDSQQIKRGSCSARRWRRNSSDFRCEVEHRREDVRARHSVDRRVMNLGVNRDASVTNSSDQIHLQERARAVQRTRVQARCLLGEHRVRAGGRKRDFAHALLEIEVGILYPIRLIWSERRVSQPPVEGCDEVQASLDNLAQSLERQGIFRRHRIDDADAPDMAEDGVRLIAKNAPSRPVSCRTRAPQSMLATIVLCVDSTAKRRGGLT